MFLQDLFCVLVAMVSISLLIVDLASAYASYQQQSEQRELSENALRFCENLLGYGPALHDGRQGAFDEDGLDALTPEGISVDLRFELGFILRIDEIPGEEHSRARSWLWSTGPPAGNRGSCVASASVHGDNGVMPARIILWAWRV